MVCQSARVRLNGKSLGTLILPPWRIDAGTLLPKGNQLEVEVVNFWPNRIIGDASLPPAERLTKTNIRNLTAKTPLEPAGMLGPVQLLEASPAQ